MAVACFLPGRAKDLSATALTEVFCLGQETNMESTAGKCEEQGLQVYYTGKDTFSIIWGLKPRVL